MLAARAPSGPWFGALVALLAVALSVTAAVYVVPLRHSLRRLRAMGDGHATLRLDDDGFEVASEAGRVELPWRAVTRLWKAPDVWVLVYTPAASSLLPAAALPAEAQAFITERVRAAGGVVDP